MTQPLEKLIEAEEKAVILFNKMEELRLIVPGKTERQLNEEVYQLATEMFDIKKFWHKRIVRAGKNTLMPYRENPPNLTIQERDIVFFDFGPVFEDWEADIGRTYVIGEDFKMLKLKKDVEKAWQEGKQFFDANHKDLTGADLYAYTCKLADTYGWEYGNIHCGHLIGNFPHEKIQGEETRNYIHPDNHELMSAPDRSGNERFWIYEIHFVNKLLKVGGFYEQLLS